MKKNEAVIGGSWNQASELQWKQNKSEGIETHHQPLPKSHDDNHTFCVSKNVLKNHSVKCCTDTIEIFKHKCILSIKAAFTLWAEIIFCHPYWSIWISIGIALFLGTGLTPGYSKWIDGADKLYALQQSTARQYDLIHSTLFKESRGRQNFVLIQASDDDIEEHRIRSNLLNASNTYHPENKSQNRQLKGNILSREYIEIASQIDRLIKGQILDPVTDIRIAIKMSKLSNRINNTLFNIFKNKQIITYYDLCLTDPSTGTCSSSSGGIIDMLSDHRFGSRNIPITPQLPMLDGFIINAKHQSLIPMHSYLGQIKSEPCIRPVPLSMIEDLKIRFVPKTFIDMSQITLDAFHTQVGIQCINFASDDITFQLLNDQWEAVLSSVLRKRHHWGPARVTFNAYRNRDDELRASTSESSDIILVIFTFLCLLGYSATITFSCDLYQMRSGPAIAGVLAAVLGLVAGMGLCCHLGLQLVPTAFVCPFLILGVGVDDMLIIINSYSLTSSLLNDPKERCRVCLRDSGLSISITTTTSMISFAIGAFSPYLSISHFCLFCGAGLFFGYVFCFSFFFAVLCLDAQREKEKRICCGVCHKRSTSLMSTIQHPSINSSTGLNDGWTYTVISHIRLQYVQMKSQSSTWLSDINHTEHSTIIKKYVEHDPPGNVGRYWRYFLLTCYGPFLMLPIVKVIVLSFFVFILGVSVYGFTKIELGLQLRDLTPLHSHLRQFDSAFQKDFGIYDMPTDIAFVSRGTPWWRPEFLLTVTRLEDELVSSHVALRIINPFTLIAGDVKYQTWMTSNNQQVFESALRSATSLNEITYYKDFHRYFIWEGPRLRAWKLTILPPYIVSSTERAQWMLQLRRICQKHSYFTSIAELRSNHTISFLNNIYKHAKYSTVQQTKIMPKENELITTSIIPWNQMMIYYESDLQILYSVVTEMAAAGLTLAGVAVVGLPDWKSGAIVVAVMIMIDSGVFGFMYFWNIKLNMISMVCLLLSIGFSVDYSTHIVHAFFESCGKTVESRVIESLALMGNPVFHGAIASLLGLIMLAFSDSYIFQIFFKMMCMVILFGMAYGVILLPVLLSIIGTITTKPPLSTIQSTAKSQRTTEQYTLYKPHACIPCQPTTEYVKDFIDKKSFTEHILPDIEEVEINPEVMSFQLCEMKWSPEQQFNKSVNLLDNNESMSYNKKWKKKELPQCKHGIARASKIPLNTELFHLPFYQQFNPEYTPSLSHTAPSRHLKKKIQHGRSVRNTRKQHYDSPVQPEYIQRTCIQTSPKVYSDAVGTDWEAYAQHEMQNTSESSIPVSSSDDNCISIMSDTGTD